MNYFFQLFSITLNQDPVEDCCAVVPKNQSKSWKSPQTRRAKISSKQGALTQHNNLLLIHVNNTKLIQRGTDQTTPHHYCINPTLPWINVATARTFIYDFPPHVKHTKCCLTNNNKRAANHCPSIEFVFFEDWWILFPMLNKCAHTRGNK